MTGVQYIFEHHDGNNMETENYFTISEENSKNSPYSTYESNRRKELEELKEEGGRESREKGKGCRK